MPPCYTPSLRNGEEIKRQLLECRTFAYPDVMRAAHEYICELEAALRSDDGWVKVDVEHPLPDDLKVGDCIEVNSFRSPISHITKFYGANGNEWHRSITAYRRSGKEGK